MSVFLIRMAVMVIHVGKIHRHGSLASMKQETITDTQTHFKELV